MSKPTMKDPAEMDTLELREYDERRADMGEDALYLLERLTSEAPETTKALADQLTAAVAEADRNGWPDHGATGLRFTIHEIRVLAKLIGEIAKEIES